LKLVYLSDKTNVRVLVLKKSIHMEYPLLAVLNRFLHKKIIPAISVLYCLLFSACKKDSAAPAFTYEGKWTVNYNFTTGSMATGVFTATLKSNGKWDYVEGAFSQTDAGTWTSSGNNINFVFNFSGLASYTGTKVTDNSLSGTAVGDAGVSTGTWTAAR
jgi:hypothetical protein